MSIGQIFGDIGYLFAHSSQLFLQGIAATLILSIVGTVVGLIIGVLLAFGRNIKILGWFCKGYSCTAGIRNWSCKTGEHLCEHPWNLQPQRCN